MGLKCILPSCRGWVSHPMRMCTEHRAGPFPWPQMQMPVSEQKQLPSSGPKASLTKDPRPWWLLSTLSSSVPEASRDTDIQRGLTGPEWLGCYVNCALLEGVFHSHVHRCGFLCWGEFWSFQDKLKCDVLSSAAQGSIYLSRHSTGHHRGSLETGFEGTLGRQWVGLPHSHTSENRSYMRPCHGSLKTWRFPMLGGP